jgi:tetratricopeptide (TPR) repeat protein
MNSNLIRKHFFSNNAFILTAAFIILMGACLLNLQIKKPNIVLSKQDTAININTKFLALLSAGHKRLITDFMWIQTLIESDTEHYKKKDLNSWLFLRFNTISILDPKFYENYSYGGQFLSIVKDDLEGAIFLYEKGLAIFPDDYKLNYDTGFINYFELGDFKKGLKYLSKVENNPKAPYFLKSILLKLAYEVSGDLQATFQFVSHSYETTKDRLLKEKLHSDLYAIKAEIDLKCLNNNRGGCDTKDLLGDPYVKRGITYHSQRTFRKYALKRRGENKSSPQKSVLDTIK